MKFVKPPRWTYRPDYPDEARRLQREMGLPELAARILANRNFHDCAATRAFLDAPLAGVRDPFELPDMDRAAGRIARAITRSEKIVVYGDYDADGICATAILIALFRFLGADAGYYIPHRVDEGYGLNITAIDKLAARGARLIVTVDNGVTANKEIDHAIRLGIDVVVADHHEPGEQLPAACAIVDPKRHDRPYLHTEYSGAGVAWKLAHGVLREMGSDPEKGRAFLKAQMDLVALATIADMVPLIGENRILARAGLGMIRDGERPGIRALMEVAGLHGSINTRHIGFGLAPRLNAVGRTRSAALGVQLMLAEEIDAARQMAQQMNDLNTERRNIEKAMLEEAMEEYENLPEADRRRVTVLAREGWHPAFVGLIASRMTEMFYRPAFIITLNAGAGTAKGSARSIAGFNLCDALRSFFPSQDSYGGHAMAAGFRLKTGEADAFRDAMVAYANARLSDEQLCPDILIDLETPLSALSVEAVEALENLQPFGEGHPRPIVSCSGVSLADTPRVVGQNHLKMRLYQSGTYISAIGWKLGKFDERLLRHQGSISVAGHPTLNEFQGRRTPELELCDIRLE